MWLTDGREVALGRLWKFLSLRADAAEPRVLASHQGSTDAQDPTPVTLLSLLPPSVRDQQGGRAGSRGQGWRSGLHFIYWFDYFHILERESMDPFPGISPCEEATGRGWRTGASRVVIDVLITRGC